MIFTSNDFQGDIGIATLTEPISIGKYDVLQSRSGSSRNLIFSTSTHNTAAQSLRRSGASKSSNVLWNKRKESEFLQVQQDYRKYLDYFLHVEVEQTLRQGHISSNHTFTASFGPESTMPPHSVTTYFLQSGEVVTEIINIQKRKRVFATIYLKVANGWVEKNSKNHTIVPFTTTPNEFSLTLWSIYIATQTLFSKVYGTQRGQQEEPQSPGVPPNRAPQGGKPKGPPPPPPSPKRPAPSTPRWKGPCNAVDNVEPGYNINNDHELKCSAIGNYLHIEMICTDVDVYIGDCCVDHDIELWCGPSDVEEILNIPGIIEWVTRVNLKLAACIYKEIVAQGSKADMPWLCGGAIVATAISIIAAATFSVIVFVATEIFSLGVWLLRMLNILEDEKHGWLGIHKDSCLCGGRTPTFADGCRDMCKEVNGGQGNQDCYDCHWDCVYQNGKLTGKRWVTDPSGKFDCCPTSTRECLDDCDGHTKHCPPCFFCYYTCAQVGNGVLMWKKVEDTSPNKLACCKPGLTPKSGRCGRLGAIY